MTFVGFFQAVAAAAGKAGVDLHTLSIAFTGFVLTAFWREIHAFKQSVERWQSKIDTTLFGATGDNGLNGTSKDHETRIRALESRETD